jgi:PadR family transcriptional regulator PadR
MRAKGVQLSEQTLKVLAAIASKLGDEASGAEIGRQAQLRSGTLYPILFRLERSGWLESRWEEESPEELGRPRRRFYRFTAHGARRARSAFGEVRKMIGGLAWE